MAYRVLEVTIQSAKDLKSVNLFSRMEVYAVVTVSGDPLSRQCTPPDPYGGRHPCWNSTFRFNVPAAAAGASGCLHVLLRTERALGDRDVGEVIVPLADILAGTTAADPGPRPQQCASYQVRKVHRCEPRGRLNVSFLLGPVVAPQHAARNDENGHVGAYPVAQPFYPYAYQPPTQAAGGHVDAVYPPPAQSAGPVNTYNNNHPAYSPAAPGYAEAPPSTPPPTQAAGGHVDAVHPPPAQSAGPVNTYNNNHPAYSPAAPGYAAAPPSTKGSNKSDGKADFGVGLGAGLVSGAIGGMLASDMMAEAAAYSYGYRAGLADGGATVYKNSQVPTNVQDRVNSNRTMV